MQDQKSGSSRFSRCWCAVRPARGRVRGGAVAASGAIALGVMLASGDALGQACVPGWDAGGFVANAAIADTIIWDDGSGEAVWAARRPWFGGPGGIVRWDGSSWTEIATADFTGTLHAIAAFNGSLYVGGDFTAIDGQPIGGIARWTGTGWADVGGGVSDGAFGGDARVLEMYVWDDGSIPMLYVGGEFETAGSVSANNIARWNGLTWNNLGSGVLGGPVPDFPGFEIAGSVATIASFDDGSGDALYVGGTFYTAGGESSPHIAKWQGGTWSSVGGGVELSPGWCCAAVLALETFDDGTGDALYVGGFFHEVDGIAASSIARWDGSAWSAVGGPLSFFGSPDFVTINTLAVFNQGGGDALFVGGDFDNADGAAVGNIARWNGAAWGGPPATINSSILGLQPFTGGSDPQLLVRTFSDTYLWSGCTVEIDADASEVDAAANVVSSFGGLTTVIVTPRDSNGNIAPASMATFLTTAGQLVGPVIDLGDGRFSQDLAGEPGVSGATVSAIVDGVEITDVAQISFVPIDPANSTIEINHAQRFLGGLAEITVTLRDDMNAPVATSHDVVISTTVGELLDSVESTGLNHQYTQTILASQIGTAAISATVDGLPLDNNASLAILSPGLFGNVIGEDAQGVFHAFMSIQAAINADDILDLHTIFVVPGEYAETILIEDRAGLVIEALAGIDPVVIHGAIISKSTDVSLRYFDIDASNTNKDGVTVLGKNNANSGIELVGLSISGASWNGIAVDVDNVNVSILDSVIHSNARSGILFERVGGPYLVDGCELYGNGHNGISVGREVEATISNNAIYENGDANGNGGGRYGIFRERQPQDGTPDQVTLISNDLSDNNGKQQPGRSDENVGNYDQVIDETDDQSPYT